MKKIADQQSNKTFFFGDNNWSVEKDAEIGKLRLQLEEMTIQRDSDSFIISLFNSL